MRLLLQTFHAHYRQGETQIRELIAHRMARIKVLTRQRDVAQQKCAHLLERIEAVTRQRDLARQKCANLSSQVGKMAQHREKHVARIQELKRQVERLEARAGSVKTRYENSISWRLTRPFRALGSWWGGRS